MLHHLSHTNPSRHVDFFGIMHVLSTFEYEIVNFCEFQQIVCNSKEDKADDELLQVLNKSGCDSLDGEIVHGTMTWGRRLKNTSNSVSGSHQNLSQSKYRTLNGKVTDGDDEILESLVKTATRTPDSRTAPRERKRNSARYSTDRK